MASQEAREAAISMAVRMVDGGCVWLRPAAKCPRLLVGMGDDTYDPECCLPLGHSGRCRPDGTAV